MIELQYSLKRCLDGLERKLLIDALKETKGNKARASRLLDVKRTTFLMKMRKFNIKPEEYNNDVN